jgi:GT2 family glycosyltransferase
VSRYPDFHSDLTFLHRPHAAFLSHYSGPYVPINRNALCQEAIDNDCEWLLMIDDDHRFSPDLLERLLAHEADVVVPLCLKRQAPYLPVIYQETGDLWRVLTADQMPATGVHEVAAAGTGCMLIHRHVLEAIPKPWFEMGRTSDGGLTGEDLEWSKKLRDHGFKILLDADTRIGHIAQVVVWPGDKQVRMELGPGIEITLEPQITLAQ